MALAREKTALALARMEKQFFSDSGLFYTKIFGKTASLSVKKT